MYGSRLRSQGGDFIYFFIPNPLIKASCPTLESCDDKLFPFSASHSFKEKSEKQERENHFYNKSRLMGKFMIQILVSN